MLSCHGQSLTVADLRTCAAGRAVCAAYLDAGVSPGQRVIGAFQNALFAGYASVWPVHQLINAFLCLRIGTPSAFKRTALQEYDCSYSWTVFDGIPFYFADNAFIFCVHI